MSNLNLYKVDLDTPQPNGRRGESPRSAFTKHNDLIDALLGGMVDIISSTAPDPAPYVTWVDTSASPPLIRRRNEANTDWVTIGPALGEFGDLAYQDEADLGLGTAATRDVGTGANTVAAGDDPRIVNAVPGNNALGTINIDTLGAAQHEGIYYQNQTVNATTERGYPITEAGSLIVTQSAYGCQQMYITFGSGKIFVRSLTSGWNGSNGPWREWREPFIPIATTSQAQALTNDATVITPKKLADAFGGGNQSLSASGYQRLPGGLIIQWGRVGVPNNSTITHAFPIAFPNGALQAVATYDYPPSSSYPTFAAGLTNVDITIGVRGSGTGNQYSMRWIALGH